MDHNGTDHVTWMLELFWCIHQGLDTSHFIGCFKFQGKFDVQLYIQVNTMIRQTSDVRSYR